MASPRFASRARPALAAAGLAVVAACGGTGPAAGPPADPSTADVPRATESPRLGPERPKRVVDVTALEFALDDPDAEVRVDAVERLAMLDGTRAVAALSRALSDPDPDIRDAAIDALEDIPGDASALALAPLLWDPDPEVRQDVVDVLVEVGGPVAVGLLEQSLTDDEPQIREAAAEYLAELADRSR